MISRRSLRLRLALAGTASIGVALVVAFFGLSFLFERHVERRVAGELKLHLDQVIAGLGLDSAGKLDVFRPPVDPRFQRPLSGLYWQIEGQDLERRSRSLWDEAIDLPELAGTGLQELSVSGPDHAELLVMARQVVTEDRLGDQPVVAAVAIDRADITSATAAFRRDLLPFIALLAAVLVAASLAQIVIGLRPLADLRERIARIRNGDAQRLGTAFPDEVQPLTSEVDALLQSREEQLRKARERASELAHAFKTPLQALSGDVLRLREAGQVEAAQEIESLIVVMRRLVDHEMARARMAGPGHSARSDLRRVVSSVVAVVGRTPAGQKIDWAIDIPADVDVRMDPDDLSELIGSLTENAARYGRSEVSIRAARTGGAVTVEIEDDGPGIEEEKLKNVLRRGERLDTTSGGAGLGLAIAESIVQTVGGEIVLGNRSRGLHVALRLPAAS
ncbi:HAMP domain-containing sensor histidine kinase [Sinorhizobium sp. BG8]|uniref:sensor histidine kinase n=1 Tax=Sinorhizobium sp. BG8 TaxID=2613773 RepID=UPI00193DFA41|nr:HAMP domain-containing sensor histidine kinase [Sinorhizobium sp. BG8]QRM54174.1 HAMP domain-containing histidine kinase [Sinorhizobium sp. BG8]